MYHIGANVHSDGNALYRPVPSRVEDEIRSFEEELIVALLSQDIDRIKMMSDASLLQKLQNSSLKDELQEVILKYNLNGGFKRRKIHSTSFWLDEMISEDPYKIYDFIVCEYELSGEKNAYATLFISKEEDFKIWGLKYMKPHHVKKNPI